MMTEQDFIKLLVVDDDEDDYLLIREYCAAIPGAGYLLDWVPSVAKARKVLSTNQHDVCLLDFHLGEISGLELLESLDDSGCDVPIIALTGYADRDIDVAFSDSGAFDYLYKGELTPRLLEKTIRYAISRKKAESERIRLNTEIEKLKRVEALGLLSGGIAHDFNNMLAVVYSYARQLRSSNLARDERTRAAVEAILRAVDRAQELTGLMRACTGKSIGVIKDFCVGDLIDETRPLLLASTMEHDIDARFSIDDDSSPMRGDPHQIRIVVHNLFTNAIEALKDNSGYIHVSLKEKLLNDSDIRETEMHRISPGRFLCLEICDNGCGMTADVQARVFEPFFSTKFVGRGIGLAAVRGIVDAHGGDIFLKSSEGNGTTVQVYFPQSRHSKLPAPYTHELRQQHVRLEPAGYES